MKTNQNNKIMKMLTDDEWLISSVETWCKTFMKEEYDEEFLDYILNVHIKLIERASWRDDETLDNLKDYSFQAFEEDYGEWCEYDKTISKNIFNEVKETLWENKALQYCYRRHFEYQDEEAMYWYIALHYEKWLKNNKKQKK
jgi:hypothetical protein